MTFSNPITTGCAIFICSMNQALNTLTAESELKIITGIVMVIFWLLYLIGYIVDAARGEA